MAAVMLFFHKKIKLVERVKGVAVFSVIVVPRLQEPYHCNAAFVFDLLAHFKKNLKNKSKSVVERTVNLALESFGFIKLFTFFCNFLWNNEINLYIYTFIVLEIPKNTAL